MTFKLTQESVLGYLISICPVGFFCHLLCFMCRKTSVFLSRETGMSGHFVGRIKGDKYRFELQYLTWDFS